MPPFQRFRGTEWEKVPFRWSEKRAFNPAPNRWGASYPNGRLDLYQVLKVVQRAMHFWYTAV